MILSAHPTKMHSIPNTVCPCDAHCHSRVTEKLGIDYGRQSQLRQARETRRVYSIEGIYPAKIVEKGLLLFSPPQGPIYKY